MKKHGRWSAGLSQLGPSRGDLKRKGVTFQRKRTRRQAQRDERWAQLSPEERERRQAKARARIQASRLRSSQALGCHQRPITLAKVKILEEDSDG